MQALTIRADVLVGSSAQQWDALDRTGLGPVFEDKPLSYRAESWAAMQASYSYVMHLYLENDQFWTVVSRFITTTFDMQTKTALIQELSLPPLACCLDLEWDFLISVHKLLSLFPTAPKAQDIRG